MNNEATADLDSVTYVVRDGHTGAVLKSYPGSKRKAARNYAEKLNQAYGAHRYSAHPVFVQP